MSLMPFGFGRDIFDMDPLYDALGMASRPSMWGDDWMFPSTRTMMPSMGYFGGPSMGREMWPRRGMAMPGSEMVGQMQQMAPRCNVINDRNQFAVNADVHHFRPEEITVKTSGDFVTIEGKHEEREDNQGYIYRHFVRKYMLPENVKAENVKSTLSADGVLTISAPKEQKALEHGGEREVPIQKVPYPAVASAAQKSVGGQQQQQVGGKGQERMEQQMPEKSAAEQSRAQQGAQQEQRG